MGSAAIFASISDIYGVTCQLFCINKNFIFKNLILKILKLKIEFYRDSRIGLMMNLEELKDLGIGEVEALPCP